MQVICNSISLYIKDLSICRFWYLRGGGPGTSPPHLPVDTKGDYNA